MCGPAYINVSDGILSAEVVQHVGSSICLTAAMNGLPALPCLIRYQITISEECVLSQGTSAVDEDLLQLLTVEVDM